MISLPKKGLSLYKVLHEIELSLIEQALTQANNSRTIAAKLLDIERTNLQMKMRKLGITKNIYGKPTII